MKIAKQWPRRVVRNDSQEAAPLPQAAGVMLLNAGKVLLLKRAEGGDHPGKWCFPGGGVEDGETPDQAAIRECHEETGIRIDAALSKIHHSNNHGASFTTYMAHHDSDEPPTLNHEHTEHAWVRVDQLRKYDLHPGVAEAMGMNPKTELEAAQMIRDGELPSPQYYANLALFDMRITGTGVSFREGVKEYVIRKPEHYLTDEFLARCNGLPVILEHPDKEALDSKEFSSRIIGTIVLPYIKGNEVWGIAKIYDAPSAKMMAEHQLSTSPSVVFRNEDGNESVELEGGKHLLIEGKPSLLDHLAVVEHGVWDKGGLPSGIKIRADADRPGNLTDKRSEIMELGAEKEARKDAEGGEGGEVVSLLKALAADIQEMKGKIAQLESAEAAEVHPAADGVPPPELGAAPAAAAPAAAAPAPAADNAMPAEHIAAMQKRMDALEGKIAPVPEPEAAKMADAQARADSVYSAHGKRAPAPLMGESLLSYRKRLAGNMQAHSTQAKGVSLAAINDEATLGVIEGIIYADAAKAAAEVAVPEGKLMRRSKTGPGGITINEYDGDPAVWMNVHLAPAYRGRTKH